MSERIGKSTMEMRRGLWWPGVVARRTTLRAVGGLWLGGRLCGLWPGDAPGDTPWADWGNAAVN